MAEADVLYDDAEIREILRRKRELAVRTAEATRRLQERNRQENRETRLRYARVERERVAEYKKKVAANLQKHSDMYSNSPFRHDVVANYNRTKARKDKEAALEREHERIYRTLQSFQGTPKIDPVRLAPRDNLRKVQADPLARIELERRANRLDASELRKEYEFIEGMLLDCLEDTRSKFPVLERSGRLPATPGRKTRKAVEAAALAPHSERTLFIRNDADFVAAAAAFDAAAFDAAAAAAAADAEGEGPP